MLLLEFPDDIIETILSFCENDKPALNQLCLANSKLCSLIQPMLFRSLVVRISGHEWDTEGLISLLHENTNLRGCVRQLQLDLAWLKADIANSLLQAIPRIESLAIQIVTGASSSANTSQLLVPENNYTQLTRIIQGTYTLRTLRQLQLEYISGLNITSLYDLELLESLELIHVGFLEDPVMDTRLQQPIRSLRRLMVGDFRLDRTQRSFSSLFKLLSTVFELKGLRDFAVWIIHWQDFVEVTPALIRAGAVSITSLSVMVIETSSPFSSPQLDSFVSLSNFTVVYPHGTTYFGPHLVSLMTGQQDETRYHVNPSMAELGVLEFPPSIRRITFAFVWHTRRSDDIKGWTNTQLPLLDDIIDREYESRWKQLQSIDFQFLLNPCHLGLPDTMLFPLKESLTPRILERGIHISTLPSLVNNSFYEWPFYYRAQKR